MLSPAERARLARLNSPDALARRAAVLRARFRDPVWRAAWDVKRRRGLDAVLAPVASTPDELLDLFVEMEPMSGCWIWVGPRDRNGYGRLTPRRFPGACSRLAHRIVYDAFGLILLAGFDLHHRCRLRCCVNPAHLEPMLDTIHGQCTQGEEPAIVVADSDAVTCLCGRTRGVFAAACCEA